MQRQANQKQINYLITLSEKYNSNKDHLEIMEMDYSEAAVSYHIERLSSKKVKTNDGVVDRMVNSPDVFKKNKDITINPIGYKNELKAVNGGPIAFDWKHFFEVFKNVDNYVDQMIAFVCIKEQHPENAAKILERSPVFKAKYKAKMHEMALDTRFPKKCFKCANWTREKCEVTEDIEFVCCGMEKDD